MKGKDEEASTASMPVKEEFDVKEKLESGFAGSRAPAQASQPSVLVNEWPHEPENPDPDRDAQENFLRVPWIDVMNELRSALAQTAKNASGRHHEQR